MTRKGRNILVPILWPGFPRKSALRSTATHARSKGARIPCTTLVIVVDSRRKERRSPISALLRASPVEQIFAKLTKKIEKLKEALKKSGKKGLKAPL